MRFSTCDIDECFLDGSQSLTVVTDARTLVLNFCVDHARAINERMAMRLGGNASSLNMYKQSIPYNIGDLQEAVDYFDGEATNSKAWAEDRTHS